VDDGSNFMTQSILKEVEAAYPEQVTMLRLPVGCGVLGRLKNLGVYWSEKTFGRGEYLYVMDNDGYYTPGWDIKLTCAYELAEQQIALRLLGPYRHPYHQPNTQALIGVQQIAITDAVQGLGHLMAWSVWDKYGPYDANAPGTNQSEDYALCRRIVDDGFLVGSIQPEVVYNCGLTDTQGKPCVGIEVMGERVRGVLYE
jgi:hypothetical protein